MRSIFHFRIQLGYVYQRQGRLKEARQIYSAALKLKLDDIALIAVASNNIVVINKDQNIFDSKKKMKSATSDALTYKLPSYQRKYISLNNALLSYYTNQIDQCNKVSVNIDKQWPDLTMYTKVLSALILLKSGKINEALDIINNQKCENPNDALYLKLCCVQFLLEQV